MVASGATNKPVKPNQSASAAAAKAANPQHNNMEDLQEMIKQMTAQGRKEEADRFNQSRKQTEQKM